MGTSGQTRHGLALFLCWPAIRVDMYVKCVQARWQTLQIGRENEGLLYARGNRHTLVSRHNRTNLSANAVGAGHIERDYNFQRILVIEPRCRWRGRRYRLA